MAIDNLYVVKRTFLDPKNPTEYAVSIALPATFTDLAAAKNEARSLLSKEGYEADFFSKYDVNDGTTSWTHGDGVIVYAEGPSGELWYVEVQTVPDYIGLQADSKGRVKAPLYHVLQSVIDYNNDRSGSQRSSIIEGIHTRLELARKQALRVLLDDSVTKEDFVEYDEYSEDAESPFGADVVVHAVKEGGQNVLVSVISDH